MAYYVFSHVIVAFHCYLFRLPLSSVCRIFHRTFFLGALVISFCFRLLWVFYDCNFFFSFVHLASIFSFALYVCLSQLFSVNVSSWYNTYFPLYCLMICVILSTMKCAMLRTKICSMLSIDKIRYHVRC